MVPAEGEYREVQVDGRIMRFDGCPVHHTSTAEIGMWLESFIWLERWHMTPVSMGLVSHDRLDPRYFDVMRLIASRPTSSSDG